MWHTTAIDVFTPEQQVLLAAAPFAAAMLLRVLLGRTEFTRWIVTLGTMWFAINVLLAPYSAGIRADLFEIGQRFR